MAESPKTSDPLTRKVIGEAMYVHRVLGPGLLESVYHKALLRRLQKGGLIVESQTPLPVHFEDEVIGEFIVDIIVEQRLILELKAVSALNSAHEVQLVNYLTATRLDVGLLINFGAQSLEVKRKTRFLEPLRFEEEAEIYGVSHPVNLVNPV
jgi:GxxExxY protein